MNRVALFIFSVLALACQAMVQVQERNQLIQISGANVNLEDEEFEPIRRLRERKQRLKKERAMAKNAQNSTAAQNKTRDDRDDAAAAPTQSDCVKAFTGAKICGRGSSGSTLSL